MSCLTRVSSACVLLLLAASAEATIIDLGNITRDTDSGIDWLDLTETNGLSVNHSLAVFPGWGIANGTQVCAFVRDAVPSGLDSTFYSCGGGSTIQFSGAVPPWATMFNLWGITVQAGVTGGSPLWGNDETGIAAVFQSGTDTGTIDVWMVAGNSGSYRSGGMAFDTAMAGVGVFLVRPIPEPAAGALLALGLVGLAMWHRR